MRLAERLTPAGSDPRLRKSLWRCSDHFIRFWFRFVRPYQTELEAGADADAYYRTQVAPNLAAHTAPLFGEEGRRWMCDQYAGRVLGWAPGGATRSTWSGERRGG